jgi:hypothetical protein
MKKILLATAIIIIAFTACKKSSVETPAPTAPTHLGLWKGKYSLTTTTEPTLPVFALLMQGGNVKIYNGADTATAIKSTSGLWSLTTGAATQIKLGYIMSGSNIINSIFFFTNDNFTASNPNNLAFWGTGNILDNGIPGVTQIGKVTFTKP